jgi:hypothetical protein
MPFEMTERGIGLELIQRETCLILFQELNNEIEAQQALWVERDKEWNKLTGLDIKSTQLEHIKPENFHPGHRPSLIEKLPKPNYPNISVMAYAGRPTNIAIDQASNFSTRVDIELMVKSERSEGEVDRRAHRTTEAIHQVLARNENLNGLSLGWENDPIVQITDIFSRRESQGAGKTWYWQASRITYSLTRRTHLPS